MSSNITKIHFSELFENIITISFANYKYENQTDKLHDYTSLLKIVAPIWNICSTAKNSQEAEKTVLSCFDDEDEPMADSLFSHIVRMKFKNYPYDKNLILHAKIEEQDGDYKVHSYLLDEKEYDCPVAQSIYNEINSVSFQVQLDDLSKDEKNIRISNFLMYRFLLNHFLSKDFIIENEDNYLDEVNVYSCRCGCSRLYKSFSLREIKNAYKAAKKELDEQFKQNVISGFKFESYDKKYLNNFEDYFRIFHVLVSLGGYYSFDDDFKEFLSHKATTEALYLYKTYPDEDLVNLALLAEPEYVLYNFVYSYISKYKDQDPNYSYNFTYILSYAMYICFQKVKSSGFSVEYKY